MKLIVRLAVFGLLEELLNVTALSAACHCAKVAEA
ncbi:MAG: hypothetical protein RLZZ188_3524, partial [Verrucomicrobiota bacterium]